MANITYLLGAGASYDALPIVENIPNSLNAFSNDFDPGILKELNPLEFINGGSLAKKFLIRLDSNKAEQEKYYYQIKRFHNDILWLKEESYNHSSIDTFAKKLYLQKNYEALKKLKLILSFFFLYMQTKKFDKRYDSFFASILEDLNSIPNNIKVLSWNYDSQLELAFQRFSNSTFAQTKKTLNIFSKRDEILDNTNNSFSVFKINGTTGLNIKRTEEYNSYSIIENFDLEGLELLDEFLEVYNSIDLKLSSSDMSFAWENFNIEHNFYKELKSSIEETDIFIVIGYSFPFFNRKVDQFILEAMKNLKKVYVQDPKYADDIIEKIKGLKPWQKPQISLRKKEPELVTKDTIQFTPKTFTDQFFIPIEF